MNDIKDKNLDVTVVTPTQQAVEQAKNEVRHALSINRARKRKIDQIGGRREKIKKKKKKDKKPKEIIRTKRRKGGGKESGTKTKDKKKTKVLKPYKAI